MRLNVIDSTELKLPFYKLKFAAVCLCSIRNASLPLVWTTM